MQHHVLLDDLTFKQSTRNAVSLSGAWHEKGLDLTSKSKPNPTCCRFLQINSWSIEEWCSLTDCLRPFKRLMRGIRGLCAAPKRPHDAQEHSPGVFVIDHTSAS